MCSHFEAAADVLSYSLGYIVHCKMSQTFCDDFQLDEDSFNKAVANAAHAAEELSDMGQGNVINSSFWSVANASFFYSLYDEFSEHQEMCDEVFKIVLEYSSHIDNAEDVDDDPVFEYTADKEHLLACLELDTVSPAN